MDDTQDAAPSSTEPTGEEGNVGGQSTTGLILTPITGDAVSATPESPTSTNTDSPVIDTSLTTVMTSVVEDPNAATDVAAQPDTLPSAPAASTPSGILGTVESLPAEIEALASGAASSIRTHLADIKNHLSIKGFEQSAVQFIHDELAKIEKWL